MDIIGEHQSRINELIEGGEWACSFGQCGTLSHVCAQLAALVEDQELAAMARRVAQDAEQNLCTAAEQWAELCDQLRRWQAQDLSL